MAPTEKTTVANALQPLDRRPEARPIKIEDLLSEVKRGRVRVPSFQRKFKWKREDARDLIDSIYRGYPIGTLLLWETDAQAGTSHFGTVEITHPSRSDAHWVVDGQQRIGSLVRVLLASSERPDPFALHFDLDQSALVSASMVSALLAQGLGEGRFLPLSEVIDSARLLRWAFDHLPNDRQALDKALDFGKRLREYEVPTYLVRSGDEATLRDIFGRTNNKGKPLKAHEVFEALNGSRTAAQPASVSQIVSRLRELQFGTVEEKVLHRLLLVLQGETGVGRSRDAARRLPEEEAAALYARTERAASRAVSFLKLDAGVPHYALLPYKQPFVALGKFFDLHPEPSSRSKDLLTRWLWRGALTGAHSGDTVSTRAVLGGIGADEAASVQHMLADAPHIKPLASQAHGVDEPFNFRRAQSKLQALALMALGPRDFGTGLPLDASALFDADLDEPGDAESTDSVSGATLTALLSSGRAADLDASKSVANRFAHPARSGLKKQVLAMSDPAILLSHGIDTEAHLALANGQISGFLRLRAQWLERRFTAFFAQRARWGETDRQAISKLVDDEMGFT